MANHVINSASVEIVLRYLGWFLDVDGVIRLSMIILRHEWLYREVCK